MAPPETEAVPTRGTGISGSVSGAYAYRNGIWRVFRNGAQVLARQKSEGPWVLFFLAAVEIRGMELQCVVFFSMCETDADSALPQLHPPGMREPGKVHGSLSKPPEATPEKEAVSASGHDGTMQIYANKSGTCRSFLKGTPPFWKMVLQGNQKEN